jgi:hypothetical protein
MYTGEVKVREQEVVTWSAECVEPTPDWPGRWNYRVKASGYANGRSFKREFILPHERNAGPLALTSSIMIDLLVMLNESEAA